MRPSETVRDAYGHHLVAVWEARGERLSSRAPGASADDAATDPTRRPARPRSGSSAGRCELAAGRDRTGRAPMPAVLLDEPGRRDRSPSCPTAVPSWPSPSRVPASRGASCTSSARRAGSLGPRDLEIARVAADALGAIVSGAQRADEVAHLLHRAEALRRVASDIGSRLDLDRILSGLVDHAMVLFEGDRARGLPPASPTAHRWPR